MQSFTVTVRTLEGKPINLDVYPSTTVDAVMTGVQNRLNMSKSDIKLSLNGTLLEDTEQSMLKLNVTEGALFRMEGGLWPAVKSGVFLIWIVGFLFMAAVGIFYYSQIPVPFSTHASFNQELYDMYFWSALGLVGLIVLTVSWNIFLTIRVTKLSANADFYQALVWKLQYQQIRPDAKDL
jgi:hypothetical protein